MSKLISVFSGIAMVICASRAIAQDAQNQDIPEFVVRKVDPAVVAIQHERAGGSGFIVTADGYILTNGHVVRGSDGEDPTEPAKSITVILHDERKFPARVLGFCMDPDVAVIKIESPMPLTTAEFGDSRNAQIGQRVFAVGTPHGLKRTFSSGILSNVDRTDLDTFTKVFQTDAAINPGNSGGPLFDREGRVLGINTYGSRGANNLGFTIPIHVVERLYHDIREHGRFVRADVPLFQVRELYDELAEALGVEHGVLVEYVMEGTPAEAAGLQAGDVMVEQNGTAVVARTKSELLDMVWTFSTMQPGTPVEWVVLRREGDEHKKLRLQATMEEAEPMIANGRFPGEIKTEKYDALGLSYSPIMRMHRIAHLLQDDPGVLLIQTDKASPAQKAELERFDIITSIEGHPVRDVDSFRDVLEEFLLKGEKHIELEVRRQQLVWRTALSPYYDLQEKKILLVVPPGVSGNLDLVVRELIAQGAQLTIVSPEGSVELASKVIGAHVPQVALADASVGGMDVLLLLDSDQASAYWNHEMVLGMIRQMYADEKMLAAIGASAITLLAAEPEILEKKITTSSAFSGEAIQRKASYTGRDVEKDANILTSTGFDRMVVRDFLKKLSGN